LHSVSLGDYDLHVMIKAHHEPLGFEAAGTTSGATAAQRG
jgi:hypothetical protein